MNVTVYSQPACQPCRATKRLLEAEGIPFVEVDTSTDPDVAAALIALGHTTSPVVTVTDGESVQDQRWEGFRPDRIRALKA
ncbi:glutaredoxin domain-containing protein [Kineococcus esterisolvens]|uniref:glutaredoxin domain-containing protein n=1 Tax=unclassified Kineococcus TaxID=2621656 RepID=UPI003D7DC5BC